MKQARFGGKQAGSYAGSKMGSLDQRLTGGAVSGGVGKANSTVGSVKSRAGSRFKGPKMEQKAEFAKDKESEQRAVESVLQTMLVSGRISYCEILTAPLSIGQKLVLGIIAKIRL